MEINTAIFLILLAIALGSFANVLIYRIPKGESIISPASYCIYSREPLKFFEKIPILSYLMLGGKSSKTGDPIPIRYLVVELLIPLISSVFIYSKLFLNPTETLARSFLDLVFIEIFICLLVALAFIDSETAILPHELTYSGIILGIIYAFFFTDIIQSVAAIGAIFFAFDFVTHFGNKFYFKEKALEIAPDALCFRLDFLKAKINYIYFAWLAIIGFYSYQFLSSGDQFVFYLLAIIGALYIINDVFLDFFFLSEEKRKEIYYASTEDSEAKSESSIGGGDAAMAAFAASIFASIEMGFMVVWLGFLLGLIYALGRRICWKLAGKKQEESFGKERITMGASLATAIITVMILKELLILS